MWPYFQRVTQLQKAPGCTAPIPGPRRRPHHASANAAGVTGPARGFCSLAASPTLLGTPHHLPPLPGFPQHLTAAAALRLTEAGFGESALHFLTFFPFVHEPVGTDMARDSRSHHEGSEPLFAGLGAAMQLLARSQEPGAQGSVLRGWASPFKLFKRKLIFTRVKSMSRQGDVDKRGWACVQQSTRCVSDLRRAESL